MRKYILMCKTTLSRHAMNADPMSSVCDCHQSDR